MSANEYRAALARLGLSQLGAARFLGVGGVTSRRWAASSDNDLAQRIPEVVAKLLRFLIAAKLMPADFDTTTKRYRYRPPRT